MSESSRTVRGGLGETDGGIVQGLLNLDTQINWAEEALGMTNCTVEPDWGVFYPST